MLNSEYYEKGNSITQYASDNTRFYYKTLRDPGDGQ